jgi:hypothetical protein
MSERITIYSVPGPSSSPGLLQEQIEGGWAYALENLKFLTALNPDFQLEVVFGHVKEFGAIPIIPNFPKINIHVYETSLTELSSNVDLKPAEQHGAILNFILSSHVLKTEFYLVLDPDCYVVKKNALYELINHMNQFNLDIVGASYPTTLPKVYYWDFPTAYFQLMRRLNCEPGTLDFLPERTSLVADTGLATANSAPFAKTFGLIAKFIKRFGIPIKEFLNKTQNNKFFFIQFTFYFYINFIYRKTPLFRDTGWKNRIKYRGLNSEIIPHRINLIEVRAGLNQTEYLSHNEDVRTSGIDPTWHALMHGIYEKRNFGKQNKLWAITHRLLGSGELDSAIFPATSAVMGKSFLSAMKITNGLGNFLYSYEYFWNHEPFCIHLGHGGKDGASKDILKLEEIKSQIMEFTGNWSENE